MLWILNPRIKMMKPINKFFVQSTESPRSCMKQIFSFMLMRCKRTLISTRVSQAAGRKQHWPRHGKLEPAKKLHSTKKKNSPTTECKQLQWRAACPQLPCCYSLIGAKGKRGLGELTKRLLHHLWGKRRAQKEPFMYNSGDPYTN